MTAATTPATDMPERIYAVKSTNGCVVSFSTPSLDYNIEYVRADLVRSGWRDIETAPRDGTRILASLYREASVDMDGFKMKAFREVREIWYQPYQIMGMQMPWHAGDPYDSHDGMAPEHMGEAVPTHWQPLPTPPALSQEERT